MAKLKRPLHIGSGPRLGHVEAAMLGEESEQGLLLYSESLAGSTDVHKSRSMMYRLKIAAGWRQ